MVKNILKFFRQNFSVFFQNILIMFISVTGAILIGSIPAILNTYTVDASKSVVSGDITKSVWVFILICTAATIASMVCNKELFRQTRKNFAFQKVLGVCNLSAYFIIFAQLFIPAMIGFIAGALTGLTVMELLKKYFFEPQGMNADLYFHALLSAAGILLISTLLSFLYGVFILHKNTPIKVIDETLSSAQTEKEFHLGRLSKRIFAFTLRTGINYPVLFSVFLAAVLTTLLANISATVEMQSIQKISEFKHITLLKPKSLSTERKIAQIMSKYDIPWLAAEYQTQEEKILLGTQKKYIFHANDAATRNKLRTIENLKLFSVMDNPISGVIIMVDDYKKLKKSGIDLSEDFEQIVDYDFLAGQTACTVYFLNLIKFLLLAVLFFILFSFILFSSANICRIRFGELSVIRLLGVSSAKILKNISLEISFFMILFCLGGSLSASIGWSILSSIIFSERFIFYTDFLGIIIIFSIGFLSYIIPLAVVLLKDDPSSMIEKCKHF